VDGWMVFFHDLWACELAFILTWLQNTCSNKSVLRVTAFYAVVTVNPLLRLAVQDKCETKARRKRDN